MDMEYCWNSDFLWDWIPKMQKMESKNRCSKTLDQCVRFSTIQSTNPQNFSTKARKLNDLYEMCRNLKIFISIQIKGVELV